MSDSRLIRIGIVVGEASGDILGAGLIQALQQHYSNIQFEGMAGERMQALGMETMFSIERLAVMGLIEPLKRLPELLSIRRQLKDHFLAHPPDVFIGIDAPDFNLGLENSLRSSGIKTIHYVSPSVWAWRQNRIHDIKRSVDKMLCLLPFEAQFYQRFDVPHAFVGHPLALELNFSPLKDFSQSPLICLMAGSRKSEVELMAPVYLDAAKKIVKTYPKAKILIPAANESRYEQLKELLALAAYQSIAANITLSLGDSHERMKQSHLVICTSGTTTLEAMLLGKPMVIGYKASALNYFLLRRFFKAPFFGLPNLLADELIVPELLQDEASSEAIAEKALAFLQDSDLRYSVIDRFETLRDTIALDSNTIAAKAVIELISQQDLVR